MISGALAYKHGCQLEAPHTTCEKGFLTRPRGGPEEGCPMWQLDIGGQPLHKVAPFLF